MKLHGHLSNSRCAPSANFFRCAGDLGFSGAGSGSWDTEPIARPIFHRSGLFARGHFSGCFARFADCFVQWPRQVETKCFRLLQHFFAGKARMKSQDTIEQVFVARHRIQRPKRRLVPRLSAEACSKSCAKLTPCSSRSSGLPMTSSGSVVRRSTGIVGPRAVQVGGRNSEAFLGEPMPPGAPDGLWRLRGLLLCWPPYSARRLLMAVGERSIRPAPDG